METKMTLTPERNVSTLWVRIEPHWDDPETNTSEWNVSDGFNGTALLRWITLEHDPAPTIIEVRGKAERELFTRERIVRPNSDTRIDVNSDFDFEACGDPCMIELEVVWHSGRSGEVRIDWTANATRSAWRSQPSASRDLAYRVTPVDFSSGRTKTAVIAAEPDRIADAEPETSPLEAAMHPEPDSDPTVQARPDPTTDTGSAPPP